MKYSFTHKINLANIDRDLWPYETEDISISDADSFEEAQQKVDRLVAERLGYYKAMSEQAKAAKNNTPSGGVSRGTSYAKNKVGYDRSPSTTRPFFPVATAPVPPVPPSTGGGNMPEEFQVD